MSGVRKNTFPKSFLHHTAMQPAMVRTPCVSMSATWATYAKSVVRHMYFPFGDDSTFRDFMCIQHEINRTAHFSLKANPFSETRAGDSSSNSRPEHPSNTVQTIRHGRKVTSFEQSDF
jgi:hypothetical protein